MTETRLTDAAVSDELAGSEWIRDGDAIVRDAELADFGAVISAVNQIAEAAEAQNHHPDILIHGWNKLRVTLSTHSAGGITAADFTLARAIDPLI